MTWNICHFFSYVFIDRKNFNCYLTKFCHYRSFQERVQSQLREPRPSSNTTATHSHPSQSDSSDRRIQENMREIPHLPRRHYQRGKSFVGEMRGRSGRVLS